MTITSRHDLGMITILPSGHIQVREDTIYERDDGPITEENPRGIVEVARTYHRRVYAPNERLEDRPPFNPADLRIRKIAALVWHPSWNDR